MKILILANDAGGLYRFRIELIEELLRRKNQVEACVPDGEYIKVLEGSINEKNIGSYDDGIYMMKYNEIKIAKKG